MADFIANDRLEHGELMRQEISRLNDDENSGHIIRTIKGLKIRAKNVAKSYANGPILRCKSSFGGT